MYKKLNLDKTNIMNKISKQIIGKITSTDEIALLHESSIKVKNISKVEDLLHLGNEKQFYISKYHKMIQNAYLYTHARIITYGEGGKYEIGHVDYLEDGIEVEIKQNNSVFLKLKLKLFSLYQMNNIFEAFLYLFYSGYSKNFLANKINALSFKDYESIEYVKKIKYHNIDDLKEVLLHIYAYNKYPTIVLYHRGNNAYAAAKLCSLFGYKCFLVGSPDTLFLLSKGFITDQYEISLDIKTAVKNALSQTTKGIYILTDI